MSSQTGEGVDFRGQKMASREGGGWAKARHQAALELLERHGRIANPVGSLPRMFTDPLPGSLEFWLLWHLHGGFDGLVDLGMSEATIYRKIKAFREAYLVHPDEVKIPGVMVDVEAFLDAHSWDLAWGPDEPTD